MTRSNTHLRLYYFAYFLPSDHPNTIVTVIVSATINQGRLHNCITGKIPPFIQPGEGFSGDGFTRLA
jgi:hypothetical protein